MYPSITEELLDKALNFAKTHVKISDEDVKIIKHARKTFIFTDGEVWARKDRGDSFFDVGMESLDGLEICELIDTFLLNELGKIIPNEFPGLYRDDGLA